MSLTDQALMNAVQYVLLEPPDLGATFPSGLWTRDEVITALSERQNRLLKSTLMLAGIVDIPALAAQHRFPLPEDWLTTVALTWFGSDGTIVSLSRSDAFEADHGLPTWVNQRDTPLLYMDEETPTLLVQIAPAPLIDGTLELVYIPESLDITGDGSPLTVPDTYALPVLKYGLLAELFGKDGRGKNPEKAAYCEMRYALGIQMAEILLNGWV